MVWVSGSTPLVSSRVAVFAIDVDCMSRSKNFFSGFNILP